MSLCFRSYSFNRDFSAYLINLTTSPRASGIVQYSSFETGVESWTVPFAVAYYLSETVLLNYLYISAKKSWSLLGSQSLAAIIFLMIGWAFLHAITQNLGTAIFAIAFIPIMYARFEYNGKLPIVPIILWVMVLVF